MNLIVDITKIEEVVKEFRKKKYIIVFTNGCFDILHRGHVEYLEKAKSYGHVLIIGLNSDESVKRIKGKNRPYVTQDDRAYILSRLEAVDVICLFEQDTPYELIRLIKPDFLVKGGDYEINEIIGKDVVEQYSGKILTIPLIQGKSSTGIIDKIRNGN